MKHMENRLQATFMPRQSVVPGSSLGRPKSPTNFFLVIAVLTLVLVFGAMGVLYAYKIYVTKSNDAKELQVEAAIKNFEPELTNKLTLLKAQLDAGKTLIDNHKAFSVLFTMLEVNTVQAVQFKQFSYVLNADKTIQISMKGEAKSYNSIAFQSDVFSKIQQLKNPMFKNITLSDTGTITFDFTATVDSSTVSYRKLISADTSSATDTQSAPVNSNGTTGQPNASTTPGS